MESTRHVIWFSNIPKHNATQTIVASTRIQAIHGIQEIFACFPVLKWYASGCYVYKIILIFLMIHNASESQLLYGLLKILMYISFISFPVIPQME